jgi:hypothetical protein
VPEVDAKHGRVVDQRDLQRTKDRPVAAESDHEPALLWNIARSVGRTEADGPQPLRTRPRLDREHLRRALTGRFASTLTVAVVRA